MAKFKVFKSAQIKFQWRFPEHWFQGLRKIIKLTFQSPLTANKSYNLITVHGRNLLPKIKTLIEPCIERIFALCWTFKLNKFGINLGRGLYVDYPKLVNFTHVESTEMRVGWNLVLLLQPPVIS